MVLMRAWLRFGLVVVSVYLTACGSSTDPEGFFLTDGGANYVVIGRELNDELVIERTRGMDDLFGPSAKLRAAGGRLVIDLNWSTITPLTRSGRSLKDRIEATWNAFKTGVRRSDTEYLVLNASPDRPDDWHLTRVALAGLVQVLPKPVMSFLRRADDPRVADYFKYQDELSDPEGALEQAAGLVRDDPDDPWMRTIYLEALAAAGWTEELETRLDEWEAAYLKRENPYLQQIPRLGRRLLDAVRADQAGRNAAPHYEDLWAQGKQFDLETWTERLIGLLDYDVYLQTAHGLTQSRQQPSPNFLNVQVMAKTMRVLATFHMLEGRRDEALRLLAADYQLGQFFSQDGGTIHRLIGTAIRAIAIKGLLVHALNACEEDEAFRGLWSYLERFEKHGVTLMRQDLMDAEGIVPIMPGWFRIDWGEHETRIRVADARFQLLRTATAVKHRLVTKGDFPDDTTPFTPLLADGPTTDPFSNKPLLYFSQDDQFVCYSVGPDETDDAAQVAYNPTNGTTSVGDILVKIPRERRFPFPRKGVRAADAEDLLRQFPWGLPVDPFASTRGRSLTVSDTDLVHIFSFGPDKDEKESNPFGMGHGPVRTRTRGSTVPLLAWHEERGEWVRQAAEEPPDDGNPNADGSASAPGQGPLPGMFPGMGMMPGTPGMFPGMMGPGMGVPNMTTPLPPIARPEVPYDPTNGTTSQGDLYMTLPK